MRDRDNAEMRLRIAAEDFSKRGGVIEGDALRARIKVLEDALEEIADGSGCYTRAYGSDCDKSCRQIARRALRGDQP